MDGNIKWKQNKKGFVGKLPKRGSVKSNGNILNSIFIMNSDTVYEDKK